MVSTLEQNHARRARTGRDTSLGITVRLGVARMLDRRTQRMVLSASIKHVVYRDAIPDPRSMLGVSDVEKIVADGEGEEVVGRRRSHQADVFRPRTQCPGSPLCPWLVLLSAVVAGAAVAHARVRGARLYVRGCSRNSDRPLAMAESRPSACTFHGCVRHGTTVPIRWGHARTSSPCPHPNAVRIA